MWPADDVDPDDFIRWAYAKALAHRQPRYAGDGRQLGHHRHRRSAVAKVKDAEGFDRA